MALFAVNIATTAAPQDRGEDLGPLLAPKEPALPLQAEPTPVATAIILFNISGTRLEAPREILERAPAASILHRLFDEDIWIFDNSKEEYIFDGSARVFQAVLVYLRTFQLHLPEGMCRAYFSSELRILGFNDGMLSSCCRPHLSAKQKRVIAEQKARSALVRESWRNAVRAALLNHRLAHSRGMRRLIALEALKMDQSRNRWTWALIYAITDQDGWGRAHPYHRASKIASMVFVWVSLSFVVVATAGFCLETLPQYRLATVVVSGELAARSLSQTCTNSTDGADANSTALTCTEDEVDITTSDFKTIELICIIYFTVELVVRAIVCPSITRFLKDFMNLVDIIAVLPFYLLLAVGTNNSSVLGVRLLRLFRVFRALKFARHSNGVQVLGTTVSSSLSELAMIGLFICIGMIIFASVMYYSEKGLDDTPFNSIPTAMWWAIVTMTTVGYGDLVPSSNLGRFIGAICAISGVLTLALPMPVFVNKFMKLYEERKRQGILKRERKLKMKRLSEEQSATTRNREKPRPPDFKEEFLSPTTTTTTILPSSPPFVESPV